MPGHAIFQTVAGAGQFTGTAGAGLFAFSDQNNLAPLSSRIVLTSIAYATDVGVPGDIKFFIRPVAAAASVRMLLGSALSADITDLDGAGDFKINGVVLPRTDGTFAHWVLIAQTVEKAVTGTVSIDYVIQNFPDDHPL